MTLLCAGEQLREIPVAQSEIASIRSLLGSKPRPIGWQARRERLDEIGSTWPVADDVTLTAVDIDGLPAEWSTVPGSDDSRVLMFFHGGGYCSGSIRSHRRMVSEAGRAAGIRTLAVGYRLAPEHPFPAAFEDASKAWRFLERHGIAADQIAVGGDSAGAGLSMALVQSLRDGRGKLPGCVWLVSPWTDLTMSGATLISKDAVDPLIHKTYLEELRQAYLGNAIAQTDPRVSPVLGDLAGLPPILIQVGSAETLLDDALRLAGAAANANVSTFVEIWPHMIHAWPVWNARLKSGRQALESAGRFMRRSLEEPTPCT